MGKAILSLFRHGVAPRLMQATDVDFKNRAARGSARTDLLSVA